MKLLKILFLLSGLSAVHSSVNADVWAEREMLAKIEKELSNLEVLVDAAKKQKDNSVRTRFDYQTLLSDISKIREGILVHLDNRMEPTVPSQLKALNTQYTERKK